MLDFKVGKVYKDTDGKEWKFIYYDNDSECPYLFREKKHFNAYSFYEQKDNTVTYFNNGTGKKIPFVEEKEREWVIGEEYECIDSLTQSVVMARLAKIIKETDSHLIYDFNIHGVHLSFHYEGIVLIMGRFAIFKDGIPQELKDRINKGKLTNKRKCFQKGQVYTKTNGNKYIFKKRIKTKQGLIAIFEDEEGFIIFSGLRKLNNIECVGNVFDKLELFADESIKGENTYKAVRVMQW